MNPVQSHSVHPAAWRNGRSGRLHRSTWVLVDHQGLRILRRAPVFNVVMTVLCVPLFLLLSVPFAFLFGPLGLFVGFLIAAFILFGWWLLLDRLFVRRPKPGDRLQTPLLELPADRLRDVRSSMEGNGLVLVAADGQVHTLHMQAGQDVLLPTLERWVAGHARKAQTDPLDALVKLGNLRDQGVLSESEFESEKRRLLAMERP